MAIGGIRLATSYGAGLVQQNALASMTPKVPAVYWMNVGYESEPVLNEETGEMVTKFISTPYGIPLDTMAKKDVSKGQKQHLQLATAQNDLLDLILKACESLQPGEDRLIPELTIQIRRINNKAEVVEPSANPFRRSFSFA
jgi:hypothetical protein